MNCHDWCNVSRLIREGIIEARQPTLRMKRHISHLGRVVLLGSVARNPNHFLHGAAVVADFPLELFKYFIVRIVEVGSPIEEL